ncbi:MAG: hypothetical protein EOP39_11985 [Rubrivivax sp.]|nr:MAG: hypothetical protein EOP39_11985 [Rubrivivax sp.]
MKQRLHISSAIAIVLALSGSASTAMSSATASISGVQWTLIDLAPGDGISPSITWDRPYSRELAWTAARQGDDESEMYLSTSQYFWFGMTGAMASQPGVLAKTSILGDALTIQGSAYRADTAVREGYWGGYWANGNPVTIPSLRFSLSPNTELVVSGTASVEASTTIGLGYDENFRLVNEQADASFTLLIFDPRAFSNDASAYLNASATGIEVVDPATGMASFSGQREALSRTFSVTYANTGTTDKVLSMSFGVNIHGFSPFTASPVPEPSTSLLALLGLPWVVRVARRARQL